MFDFARLILGIGALICSATVLAVEPYGTTASDPYLNAKFYAQLSVPRVTAANYKISGTNITLNCGAKVETATTSNENKITHVRLKHAKLEWNIEPSIIFDYEYPVQWGGGPGDGQGDGPALFDLTWQPHDIVFSSVILPDQSSYDFTLTLTFEVKRQDQTIEVRPPLVTTLSAKAHNVVSLWRTSVTSAGAPLSFADDLLAHAVYNVLHPFYDAANHSFSGAESVNLDALKTSLRTATAMVGVTHGSQTGMADSVGVGAGHTLTWPGFSPELSHHGSRYSAPTASMIPPTNISLFYSCGTMPGADTSSLNFWMMRNPLQTEPLGTRLDSALGGFNVPIILYNDPVQLGTPAELVPSSANHVRVIYEEMYDNGVTFGRAVSIANVSFPPRPEDPTAPRGSGSLLVKGDAESTFYYVYVPASKRSAPDYQYQEVLYITTPPPPGN